MPVIKAISIIWTYKFWGEENTLPQNSIRGYEMILETQRILVLPLSFQTIVLFFRVFKSFAQFGVLGAILFFGHGIGGVTVYADPYHPVCYFKFVSQGAHVLIDKVGVGQ